jgi:hypothetical protein
VRPLPNLLRMTRLALLSALALLCAVPVAAKTLNSAMNGIDGAECGPTAAPCRSISAALANASDGDTILVGPGYYGDLANDGDWAGAGDEAAEIGTGCDCVIAIRKRVTLKSRDGSDTTVIDAADVTNGVWFGPGGTDSTLSGFTIQGAENAVYTNGESAGMTIANTVARGGTGPGFSIVNSVSEATLRGDHAIGRGSMGFNFVANVALKDCIAQSNGSVGFYGAFSTMEIQKSVAVGNGDFGFISFTGQGEFKGISALANASGGVSFYDSNGFLTGSTLSGNGRKATACTILNFGISSFTAENDFWGGPGGLGVPPATPECPPGNSVNTFPFKKTEIKVVPKAIR